MRNKIFTFLLLILLIIGLSILIKPQTKESILEKRPLALNTDIKFNNLLDGSLLTKTDTVLKDQFFKRDFLMQKYYESKIFFNKVIAGSSNEGSFQYLSDNVIEIDGEYLINNILIYNEDNMNMASSKGYNINEMDLKYPDVKTYVYMPTRLEEIYYVPSDSIENFGHEYKRNFLIQLNENISSEALKLNSFDDHKEYYYKTDFHWNNKGGYAGYSDIINMIGKDFNIDAPREIENEVCYPYEFRGNISSEIGKVSTYDNICDYKLKGIGEYKRYVNGEESYLDDTKDKYAKQGNDSMFSDYDVYFGNNDYERIYDFNQEDKPNVLVFVDSYFNVIQEWFASHFNKTILIDLRGNDGSFNLEHYLNEYDVDIILVSQMYKNLYFNGNTFIPLY